jgi:CheY-like chemotaxis protein
MKKILVVDSDKRDRNFLSEYLESFKGEFDIDQMNSVVPETLSMYDILIINRMKGVNSRKLFALEVDEKTVIITTAFHGGINALTDPDELIERKEIEKRGWKVFFKYECREISEYLMK